MNKEPYIFQGEEVSLEEMVDLICNGTKSMYDALYAFKEISEPTLDQYRDFMFRVEMSLVSDIDYASHLLGSAKTVWKALETDGEEQPWEKAPTYISHKVGK